MRTAFFCLFLISVSAEAKITKLDPLLRQTTGGQVRSPFAVSLSNRDRQAELSAGGLAAKAMAVNEWGEVVADCFVRIFDPQEMGKIADRIRDLGGEVRTQLETVMTASIPVEALEEVAGWEEVRYVEGGKPLSTKLSTSIQTVNADDVHAGAGLDARYDGSGSIVGIVDDTRLDWQHADFEDSTGNTRILFLWDKNNTGSGVSEISDSTGLECSRSQIDAGTCTATTGGAASSHASHVAGIAAGGDATFKGMAPGADIINVFNVEADADSGGDLSTTIVDDARYVFAKADSLGQPAVVNLSLGTSIGAHDSTSSLETALNELVQGHPGRAIVNAQGNERFNPNDSGAATYNGIHAAINVTSGTDEAFDFAIRSGSTVISNGREVIVDIWLLSASTCTVELDAFDFAKTAVSINMGAVSAGGTGTATNGSGTTLTVDFGDSDNANNGKKHAVAKVAFTSAVSAASMEDDFSFDVIFRGTCQGDAWLWPDRTNTVAFTKRFSGTDQGFGYVYQMGDSDKTATIPGTATGVIAVGSFMSRTTWTDINETSHSQTASSGSDFTSLGATGGSVGAISLFSSLGPGANGLTKPDISAPGEPIVSTLGSSGSVSTGRKVNTTHFKNEGTSMSAPHVAGIIALMFQKNKCLTSDNVRSLIVDNAKTDDLTGSNLPNNIWGYGKVDAQAIMKDVVTHGTGVCTVVDSTGKPLTPVTTTSGVSGGGGCLNLGGQSGAPAGFILFAFLLISALTYRVAFNRKFRHAAESFGVRLGPSQTGNSGKMGSSGRKRSRFLRV